MMSLLETQSHAQGLDPGSGVHWNDLDGSRQEVVQLCGEKGRALFSFFLASSSTGEGNTAVVNLTRLADTARQLGWSADTVKRYVAVFRAIKLVSHYRGKLLLPLGPYTPLTAFSALDELAGKRDKQRQLALKVKTRYILRFGDPTRNHSEHLRQTLHGIKTILEDEHLEPLKRERLQMKIAEMIASLAGAGIEQGHQQGDPKAFQGDVPADTLQQKPDPALRVGDLKTVQEDPIEHTSPLLRSAEQNKGDSDTHQGDPTLSTPFPSTHETTQEGDLKDGQGDPTPQLSLQDGETAKPMGDLSATRGDSQTHGQGHMGDSNVPIELKEGDSETQSAGDVQVDALYTYNVSYLINNITKGDNAIRKRIAQFLAKALEKNDYENGYPTFSKYLKAFKQYTPDVIGRAFLVTIVLVHGKGWQVDSLGATFTTQCKRLSGLKPLADYTLDEVEAWLNAWGHLAYPELLVAVTAPPAAPHVSEPASLITGPQKAASNTQVPSGRQKTYKKGNRTYGIAYTGRPTPVNKRIHSLSSPERPTEKS